MRTTGNKKLKPRFSWHYWMWPKVISLRPSDVTHAPSPSFVCASCVWIEFFSSDVKRYIVSRRTRNCLTYEIAKSNLVYHRFFISRADLKFSSFEIINAPMTEWNNNLILFQGMDPRTRRCKTPRVANSTSSRGNEYFRLNYADLLLVFRDGVWNFLFLDFPISESACSAA